MLTKDGVIARLIFTFCLFYLSGTQILIGIPAAICGVMGTALLVSALLMYSPLYELYDIIMAKRAASKTVATKEEEINTPFLNHKKPA